MTYRTPKRSRYTEDHPLREDNIWAMVEDYYGGPVHNATISLLDELGRFYPGLWIRYIVLNTEEELQNIQSMFDDNLVDRTYESPLPAIPIRGGYGSVYAFSLTTPDNKIHCFEFTIPYNIPENLLIHQYNLNLNHFYSYLGVIEQLY